MYLILARSIREHGRYVNLHIPGEPPHTKFPPLFPLLLAIFSGGRSIVGAKLLMISIYWILLCCIFRFYNDIDRKNGWFLFLLFSLTHYMLLYAQSIYSDVPYTLFSFLSLYFAFLYERKDNRKYLYFSIIFAIAAFYTRTIGIALLSVPLWLFLRKRRKEGFIYGIILMMAMALWFGRNKLVGGGASVYFEQWKLVNPYIPQAGTITFQGLLLRIASNLLDVIFREISMLLLGVFYKHAALMFLFFIPFAILTTGYVCAFKRYLPFTIYIAFYFLIYLLWPSIWVDARFLIPLLPFFVIFLREGIFCMARKMKRKETFFYIVGGGVIGMNLFLNLMYISYFFPLNVRYLRGDHYCYYYSPRIRSFIQACQWIKENTPPDAVVMGIKPARVYWHSERKCIRYPRSSSPEVLWKEIERNGVDYLFIYRGYSIIEMYAVPAMAKMPERFSLVKEIPPTSYVYRVIQ